MSNERLIRPWSELMDSGLLWLVNRQVFHPMGFSLSLHLDEHGEPVGWSIIGDGGEICAFPYELEQEYFDKVQATLDAYRRPPAGYVRPSMVPVTALRTHRPDGVEVVLVRGETIPDYVPDRDIIAALLAKGDA